MSSRTVLIGYNVRGRRVVAALRESGCTTGFTVVDSDPRRAEQAVLEGVHAVVGPCWRLRTLWLAGAHTADHIVVAVQDDDMAQRIISAVRSINDGATIITIAGGSEPQPVVKYLGADHIVNVSQADEWAPDAERPHDRGHAFADLEWTVAERAVTHDEIGCSPLDCRHQVLAVVRRGQRLWAEDPAVAVLRGEDRLLVVTPGPPRT
ncbi:Trk K+ transport system NAD-binding subunit [Lentzea atacamensis]|uniref:Trk K+ transport system NAD-binding subunit n=1 Tax=Lentzea atacamensis TaxID=531938 RepID=A0A316HW22_9PSEU|nr:NAD(P)-binding protein [Lentzea atacamensis]PWK84844.1 Trk K+ transport system NAD-binding subunit [Lentzea atacamensis]